MHRFRPTSGGIVGYLSLASIAAIVLLLAATERNLTGLQWGLVLALVAWVVWVALLRPRAVAYRDVLVLHNLVRDTHVPLARIDDAVVRQTLNVWVGDDRYTCAGIGRSTRSLMRAGRSPMGDFGPEPSSEEQGAGQLGRSTPRDDYATFVERSIDELARAARRDHVGEAEAVRRTWAVPELVALGVLVAALAVTLLLR